MTRILRMDGITGMEAYLEGVDARLKENFKFQSFTDVISYIRGPLVEAMQESFVLHATTPELLKFYAKRLFYAVREAVNLLDSFLSTASRVEVISAWHAIVLTDAALSPYSASIRQIFEDQFVKRIMQEYEWPAELKSPEEARTDEDIATLNRLVDFVNIIRSCPQSQPLRDNFLTSAPESIKPWAQTVL